MPEPSAPVEDTPLEPVHLVGGPHSETPGQNAIGNSPHRVLPPKP